MIVTTTGGELKLAANLKWLFTELPLEERFDAAAQAGFTGVELPSPYQLSAPRMRELIDAAGLKQVLINTPPGEPGSLTAGGAAAVPGAREEFRQGVLRSLDYATVLETPIVHVMAGVRPAGADPAHSFATYVANIAWAAERAKSAGIRIVLEAINKRDQPGYGLESMEIAATVAATVDPDTVGVLFDCYHAQVDRGNLIERFEQLLPHIGHMQIADNPGRGEPGTGEIAYERVLARVAESQYDGWVGCEYGPVDGSLQGLSWTKGLKS